MEFQWEQQLTCIGYFINSFNSQKNLYFPHSTNEKTDLDCELREKPNHKT